MTKMENNERKYNKKHHWVAWMLDIAILVGRKLFLRMNITVGKNMLLTQ